MSLVRSHLKWELPYGCSDPAQVHSAVIQTMIAEEKAEWPPSLSYITAQIRLLTRITGSSPNWGADLDLYSESYPWYCRNFEQKDFIRPY